MNDNTKGTHVPRQGVDHLPGQMDLIEHAKLGAPPTIHITDYPSSIHDCVDHRQDGRCSVCFKPVEKPFEDLGPNVVVAPVITSHDLPVQRILQGAHEAGLEMCIVVGYTKSGDEYFASNVADGAEIVWCMERAKFKLLNMVRGGSSLEGFDGDGTPPTTA